MNRYRIALLERITRYKATLYYLLASVGGAALGFFLFPIYTGPLHLTPDDFGIIGYTQSVNSFLVPLFQLSFTTYYIKIYFEKNNEEQAESLGSIVYFLFAWNIFLILLLTVIGSFMFSWLGVQFNFFPYMFLVLWSNLFSCFYTFLLLQYRMERKAEWFMFQSFLNAALVLGLPLLIMICWVEGVEGRLLGFTIGTLLSGIISFFLLRPKMKMSIRKDFLKKAFRFSAPLIPYALIMLLYDTIDRVYIEKNCSLEELGYYNVAMQFSSIAYMVAIAYYRAMEPEYFELATGNKTDILYRNMLQAVIIFFVLAILMLLGSGFLIRIMTNESYEPAIPLINRLMLAVFMQSVNLLVFTFLTIRSQTREMLYISIAGLIVYLGAMVVLGEKYGIHGITVAKILLHVAIFVIAFCFIRQKGNGRLLLYILSGMILLLAAYLLIESC